MKNLFILSIMVTMEFLNTAAAQSSDKLGKLVFERESKEHLMTTWTRTMEVTNNALILLPLFTLCGENKKAIELLKKLEKSKYYNRGVAAKAITEGKTIVPDIATRDAADVTHDYMLAGATYGQKRLLDELVSISPDIKADFCRAMQEIESNSLSSGER